MLEIPIDQVAEQGEESPEARAERLQLFGERLDKLFREQVGAKSLLEQRWLKDIRQYSGEYEDDVLANIKAAGGSEAFVNFTRVKCNSTESRLAEMLLPTDDRNWSIEPTPIPELQLASRSREPVMGPDGKPAVDRNGKLVTQSGQVAAVQEKAKQASDRMQLRMDDQLEECSYNAVCRNVIHNMAVYGTGILKGPVIRNKARQTFQKTRDIDPETGVPTETWQLSVVEDLAPCAESVSPWDFFPDMRATTMQNCEFVFERHRFNKQRLRDLAKLPGFLPDQINAVLETEPEKSFSGLVDTADSADKTSSVRGGYEVIEYTGPIDPEDLLAAGVQIDVADKLTSHQGTVWFCQNRVLKAVLSMLDSGELMYDVVPLERDDTMIFGFGVPRMMRHSQRAGNAAWRMILDNARLSVGGQVIWKQGKVRPINGDTRLSPNKGWEVTDPNANVNDVFAIVPVPAVFGEMFNILETTRQFQDEETGLPQIAQGQQSPAITKTAQGMSILMNSANTVLRRMVKEFDDSVTSRFIRRLYHWNMQYGDDEQAKGDYQIIPLGSTSLMVREQQTEGLMRLAELGGSNPEFMRRLKWGEILSDIVRSMNINAEGRVKSDDELKLEEEQAKQNGQQIPPELQLEMAKMEVEKAKLQMQSAMNQAELQIKQAEAQAEVAHRQAQTETERAKIQATVEAERMRAMAAVDAAQADMARVQVDRELALLKLAAEREMTLEQVRASFGIEAMRTDSKHQLFNAESKLRRETGEGI